MRINQLSLLYKSRAAIRPALIRELRDGEIQLKEKLNNYPLLIADAQEQHLFDRLNDSGKEFLQMSNQLIQLMANEKTDEARYLERTAIQAGYASMQQIIKRLGDYVQQRDDAHYNYLKAALAGKKIFSRSLTISFVALVALTATLIWIAVKNDRREKEMQLEIERKYRGYIEQSKLMVLEFRAGPSAFSYEPWGGGHKHSAT